MHIKFSYIEVFLIILFFVPENTFSHAQGGRYIGEWTYYAHGTRAGSVYIVGKRTILIKNFFYDGRGPEAWFQVKYKKTPDPPQPCANHRGNPIIPDEEGICMDKPRRYMGEDIILTIPIGKTWAQVDWIALYCYRFQHLFGYIKIPKMESLATKDMIPRSYRMSSFLSSHAHGPNPPTGLCPGQHKRILADSTFPVTCSIDDPSNTSGGNFP